jgi:hypothetical protein
MHPLSKFRKPVPRLRLRLNGWRMCAHFETISGPQEVPDKEAEHQLVASVQGACGEHAGSMLSSVGCGPDRVVARILLGRWQVGAEAECCGCCLGGGRLGGAEAGVMGRMPLLDQGQPKQSSPAAAH